MIRQRKALQRTTPLRSVTPLERTRLRSSGPALRPVKPRKAPQGAQEKEAKRLTRVRSGGWCELRLPGICVGRAYDFSHRIAAGRGGKWTASNGCDACRWCHDAITNTNGRRAEYERLGYICKTGVDTTLERVWLRGERWVWLTDDDTEYLDTPPKPVPLSDYQDQVAQEASHG
jgi:hypothetical protein